jgi:hypothetical protein
MLDFFTSFYAHFYLSLHQRYKKTNFLIEITSKDYCVSVLNLRSNCLFYSRQVVRLRRVAYTHPTGSRCGPAIPAMACAALTVGLLTQKASMAKVAFYFSYLGNQEVIP